MSGSYEKINYSIRPAKCIERKMLCEAFLRLSIFGKIENYRYIGFGSTFFSDFALFHKFLNICNMVSIEKDVAKKDRFEFNRPYQCIRMEYGNSNEVFPTLHWQSRSIVWLDYDSRLTKDVLLDIKTFCANSRTGSMIIISVNAEPEKADIPYDEIPNYRIDQLKKEFGADRVSAETGGKELAKWGTANVYRKIINNEILQTIESRNGILEEGNKLCYRQLFNFNYSDNAKMLTTGGILFDEGQKHLIGLCDFDNLSFIRHSDEPYQIEVPSLTLKEIRHLGEQLPRKIDEAVTACEIKTKDVENFEKIYRYFPAFSETNL